MRYFLLFIFLTFTMMNVCAKDKEKILEEKIKKLENDFYKLQYSLYSQNKSKSSNIGAVNATKIDELNTKVNKLTSLVEQMQFEVNGVTERMVKMSNDIEFRINEIDNKLTDSLQTQSTLDSIDEQLDDDFLKSNGSDATEIYKKTLKTIESNPELDKLSPEQQYQAAYNLLKKQKFEQSLKYFEYFIANNNKHALVSNAYYWIGEIFFRNFNFERSAVEYLRGYQIDIKGTRAADNLLKLGISLSNLEKRKEACIALLKLKKEFSHLSSNVKARMNQELDKLNCDNIVR